MRLGAIATAILALALTTGVASADVITTYTATNIATFQGGAVSGSFMVDQTTHTFDGGSLSVSSDSITDSNGTYHFQQFLGSSINFVMSNTAGFLIFLNSAHDDSASAVTSGSIDEASVDLIYSAIVNNKLVNKNDTVVQGTLTAASVTTAAVPEPASLALLGTAIAGLRLIRRRKRAA